MSQMSVEESLKLYKDKLLPFYEEHLGKNIREHICLDTFIGFLTIFNNCFSRDCLPGHFTASALVVNPDMDKVVLCLHGKLKEWLQLGGHADEDTDLIKVACKEVEEESGLKQLSLCSPLGLDIPFDIDFHRIPEHKGVPQHIHYDVRYLIVTKDEKLIISDESDDLRWFNLVEAEELCPSEAMQRQFRKLRLLGEYNVGN